MDLLDFAGNESAVLYYEEALPAEVTELLEAAANAYSEGGGEMQLLRAFFLAPDSLKVLVSLYRFYYYQHSYTDTLATAHHALRISGQHLGFPADWRALTPAHLEAQSKNMGLVRFYLLALKGAAYVQLRLNELKLGEQMLDKVLELDPEDRLGASVLKQVMEEQRRRPKLVYCAPPETAHRDVE